MTDYSKNYTNQPYGVIKRMIENSLMDFHVCLPAKIVKYDYETQKADCQPLLKKKYRDGTIKSFPVITAVPVCFPRVSDSYIYLPVKIGDKVLLIFSDYSLDNYLFSGNESEPLDMRFHHLTDAFCIPSGYDFKNPIDDLENADDAVVKNDKVKFILKPDGTFSLKGKDGVDLVEEAYNLADEGNKATVTSKKPKPDAEDPSSQTNPLDNASAFGAIKTKLGKIKT